MHATRLAVPFHLTARPSWPATPHLQGAPKRRSATSNKPQRVTEEVSDPSPGEATTFFSTSPPRSVAPPTSHPKIRISTQQQRATVSSSGSFWLQWRPPATPSPRLPRRCFATVLLPLPPPPPAAAVARRRAAAASSSCAHPRGSPPAAAQRPPAR